MKTLSAGILFLIFIINPLASFAQWTVENKFISYSQFISSPEFMWEVLSQKGYASKSRSCTITCVDSTYMTRANVKPNSVSESIVIDFDSIGNPAKLQYSFRSNVKSYSATATYFYSGDKTFIKCMDKTPLPVARYFLWQISADRKYEAYSEWTSNDEADTSRNPTFRMWQYNNYMYVDSLVHSSSELRLLRSTYKSRSSDSLVSFRYEDRKAICKYERKVDGEKTNSIQDVYETVRYTFNEAGRVTMKEIFSGDQLAGFYQWWYDANNRLIYYETSYGNEGMLKITIKRGEDGRPVLMKLKNDLKNVEYKFNWQ